MKIHALSLVFVALLGGSLQAQTAILGPGAASPYNNPFATTGNATVNPSDGSLISLTVGGSVGPTDVGLWDLSATGGLSASIAGLGLTESGSRTAINTSNLTFSTTSAPAALTTLFGVAATLPSTWTAKYTFDQPGNIFSITAGQTYTIGFDVAGLNGLLDSTALVNRTFTFSFLDGNNNVLTSASNGNLISLVGLFGPSGGSASFTYTPTTSVAGAASLLFQGSADLNAVALNAGRTVATVSNITVTAAPVPEPSGALLIAAVGIAVTMRRFRGHSRQTA